MIYVAYILGLMGVYLIYKGIRYTGPQSRGDIVAGIMVIGIGAVIIIVTHR